MPWNWSNEAYDLVGVRLSVRDLFRICVVCRQLRAWHTGILEDPSTYRRNSFSTVDWYFPTTLCVRMRISPAESPNWSGVHHSTEGTQGLQRLPSLHFLPASDLYHIVAGDGGLLWLQKGERDSNTLVVCNPLTRKWSELAPLEYAASTIACSENVKHMVVDPASNTYKAFIISGSYVCEYASMTNQWSIRNFEEQREHRFVYSSVYCNLEGDGRGLIYSLMEHNGDLHTVVEAYDIDARTWLPETMYTLHDPDMHFELFGDTKTFAPSLVACKSDLYAIIPAEEPMAYDQEAHPFFYATIRFHIFKLHEGNGIFTQVAVLPIDMRVIGPAYRDFVSPSPLKWYSCTAHDNVIWLACGPHIIEYNTSTNLWRTQMLAGVDCGVGSLPYTPSFEAKP